MREPCIAGSSGSKGLDLLPAHLVRVPLAAEVDESLDPVQICFPGAQAVVLQPQARGLGHQDTAPVDNGVPFAHASSYRYCRGRKGRRRRS